MREAWGVFMDQKNRYCAVVVGVLGDYLQENLRSLSTGDDVHLIDVERAVSRTKL